MGMPEKACWNTLGRVMNTSEGPLSGFTPTAAAAGNIISPARIATTQSISATCVADFIRSVFRSKYEAYVHRQAVPRLSEKNAWPSASSIVDDVMAEKSGLKRNSMPLPAPGSRHDATTMPTSNTSNVGMRRLEARSTPPFTPRVTTTCVTAIKASAHSAGLTGWVEKVLK